MKRPVKMNKHTFLILYEKEIYLYNKLEEKWVGEQ